MFPRVLGNWAGQAAGRIAEAFQDLYQSIQRFQNSNETAPYRHAMRDIVISAVVPGGSVLLATHWLVRAAAQLARAMEPQQKASPGAAQNGPRSTMEQGAACYLQAAAESDPFLISPFGTMPMERCLGR